MKYPEMNMKLAALVLCLLPLLLPAQTTRSPERLKGAVAQMLKEDDDNPPSSEGVLFAGGDTIAGWDVRHSFGRYRTVRRGIPGGTLADSAFYADQLIVPLKPSTIVVESGDTAFALGMSSDAIVSEFKRFIAKIHETLPKTRLVVLPVRPDASNTASPAAAKTVNDAIAAAAAGDKLILFADLDQIQSVDGKPDPSTLADGKMQLNKLGYQLLTQCSMKELLRSESRYWSGTDPMGR